MMSMLRAFLKIPFSLWLLVLSGFLYFQWSSWQTQTLNPLQQDLASAKTQLQSVKKQNKEAEDFERQRDIRFQELQKLAQDFNDALERLPKTSDIPGILTSLADISDRVGIEFSKFEPGKPELKGFLTETQFKVELRGTFVQILSFLDEIAHLKRIISGRSFDLKEPISKGDSNILKAELVLVTYHFDENAKPVATSTTEKVPVKADESTKQAKNETENSKSSSSSSASEAGTKGDGK